MKNCKCKNFCNCNSNNNDILKLIAIDIAQMKNAIEDLENSDRNFYWNNILNKPDVFPPSYHTHSILDVEGLNDIVLSIDNKVDKENGKSLVDNTLITKLFQDYTKAELDVKFQQVNLGINGTVTTSQTLTQLNALPDGIYEAQTSGTYANGLIAKVGYFTKFKKVGTSWTLDIEVKMPEVDTSTLVSKSSISLNSIIRSDSTYIINNTLINSAGGILASPGTNAKSIVDFPLEANTTYTIGGFLASNGKNFALVDSSGVAVQAANLAVLPKTFTTDSTHIFLRCCIKQVDSTESSDNWSNTLMLNKGTTLLTRLINKIDFTEIQAQGLGNNNTVPDPINSFNGVNKNYFDINAVRTVDLTLVKSANIADPKAIISNQFIGNNGNINIGTGWKMISIDVSSIPDGTPVTFGRFTIDQGGYSAFHNTTGLVQYNGSYVNSNLPKTVIKPTGATILYIDISRPTGTNEYSQVTVNIGNSLIAYVPYATISQIKGYNVSGGNSNVQKFSDLTDVPTYAGNANKGLKINSSADGIDTYIPVIQNGNASFASLYATGLILDLPTSPVGLQIGDAWLDGDIVKVKII